MTGVQTCALPIFEAIRHHAAEILAGRSKSGRTPELWDGHAAERIAADLAAWLIARQS